MPNPKVSILMPMRNAGPFVGDALRSLLAENQVPTEIVVVDDKSTDDSRAVVGALGDSRIKMIDGPGRGIAAAFNAALEHCNGEIVMRCDADDLYPAGRIARQVEWLDAHSEFGAICGAYSAMDSAGRNQVPFKMSGEPGEITPELKDGVLRTSLCTFAIRSEVLKELGGARGYFNVGEDIDLMLRLSEKCRIWYSPELAYCYRLHDASATHSKLAESRFYYLDQARAFQVQRQSTGADDLELGKARPPATADGTNVHGAREHLQQLLIGSAWWAVEEGRRAAALNFSIRAVKARPIAWAGWRNLIMVALKTLRT